LEPIGTGQTRAAPLTLREGNRRSAHKNLQNNAGTAPKNRCPGAMLASSSDRLTASSTRICSGGKNLRQALELKTGRQERKTNKGLAGGTTCEREELTSKTKQVAVNSSGEKQNLWENSQREQKALSGNVETAVKSRETESEREEKTKSKNRRRETARRAQTGSGDLAMRNLLQ
jgi:hypothetical protein